MSHYESGKAAMEVFLMGGHPAEYTESQRIEVVKAVVMQKPDRLRVDVEDAHRGSKDATAEFAHDQACLASQDTLSDAVLYAANLLGDMKVGISCQRKQALAKLRIVVQNLLHAYLAAARPCAPLGRALGASALMLSWFIDSYDGNSAVDTILLTQAQMELNVP